MFNLYNMVLLSYISIPLFNKIKNTIEYTKIDLDSFVFNKEHDLDNLVKILFNITNMNINSDLQFS
jgi:hypothetical protein